MVTQYRNDEKYQIKLQFYPSKLVICRNGIYTNKKIRTLENT